MAYSVPSTSTALRPSTSSPSDGSRTITITVDPTKQDDERDTVEQDSREDTVRVLRLKGARKTGPRVAWDDDVVDNEHMGKKKSKSTSSFSIITFDYLPHFIVCCIYHKPRPFDESSSDESSDSDSDSNSSCGGDGRRNHRRGHHHHHHHHMHKPHNDDGQDESCDSDSTPNAYERQPKPMGKGKRKEGEVIF